MPVALKFQADENSLDDVRSQVNTFFDGVGQEAGELFTKGLSNTLSGALSGVASEFGGFGKAAESALSGVVSSASAATLGIAGMAAAAVAVGKAFYDMGAEWDKIGDSITGTTGAMGAQLDGIVESVRAVSRESTLASEEIGKLAGGVYASLHLSGQSLTEMTDQLSKLKELTNESVDTKDLGKAFRMFDIQGVEQQKAALNELLAVAQATQTPINDVVNNLLKIGPAGKEAGLGLNDTLGMIIAIEEAGGDVEKLGPIMTAAMRSWAKEGRDANQALDQTVSQIKALIDSGNDPAAQGLAFKEFGKNAQQVFNAIKDGTLDVQSLHDGIVKLGDTKDLIDQQIKATRDWDADIKILKNTLKDDLYPAAHFVFGAINTELQSTLGLITGINKVHLFPNLLGGNGITLDFSKWGWLLGDQGGGGGSGLPTAAAGPTQGGFPGAQAERRGSSSSGAPGGSYPGLGNLGPIGAGQLPTDWATGQPVQPKQKGGAGGSGELVPYGPGYGVMEPGESPEQYRARMNVLEQQHNVAEKQAQLDKLEASHTATQEQLTKARNDVLEAQVRANEAEQAMNKPGTSKSSRAEVPYGEGYGAPMRAGESMQQYQAEQNLLEAQHNTAEARANLQQVEASGTATANELTKARNDLAKAEAAEYEAQLRLTDSTTKSSKQLDNFGTTLDKDFGLSKGLPGLADNLVRFIGSIAAAPLMGMLGAVSSSQGGLDKTGSGLIGMAYAMANPPETSSIPEQYGPSGGSPSMVMPGMPSILQDTGSVASGPQSRAAASMIEQIWGPQLRGKIGGSRDNNTAKNTHDAGLAIDIPIGPDQGALGDEINAWLQSNAGQLGLKYSIWRDQGKYPGGGGFGVPAGSHQNHIDAQFDGSGNVSPAMAPQQGAARGFSGSSIPIPLPVTIVGGSLGTDGTFVSSTKPTGGTSKDANALAIIQEGARRGMSPAQIQAALGVAMQETDLGTNPRTNAIQNQNGTPGIQGMFQQDNSYNRYGDKTDPAVAARGFFDQFISRGGMNAADPWQFAVHNVQKPAALGAGGYDDGTGNYLRQRWGGPAAEMYNRLSPTLYDGGGPLMPGVTLAQNNTGKTETVLTNEQATALSNVGKQAQSTPTGNIGAAAQGPGGPGTSTGRQGPTEIGGKEPKAESGASQGGGGGIFGAAVGAGSMAADAFAPGSGAAVQIAGQEIQRAIKAGGQAAGIGVGALMETFLPTGASEIANNSWITRIAGGFSGMGPQLPNLAGKAPTPVPNKAPAQALPFTDSSVGAGGKTDSTGATINLTLNSPNHPVDEKHMDYLTNSLQRQYEATMPQAPR